LGQDLSGIVKFSDTWDNLVEPSLVGNDIAESTVAIVGGTGEGAARTFEVVTGPNYVADYNDMEVFVDARSQEATSLIDAGTSRLRDLRARDDFRFNVRQSGAWRYGRDYCEAGDIGDLVTVQFYEGTGVKRIVGVNISFAASSGAQSSEQIRLDMVAT
jgi:hypothetical protein